MGAGSSCGTASRSPGAGSGTAEHIRRRISPEIPVFCQNLLKKANGCAIIQLWSRRISTLPAHTETANSGVQPNGPDLAGLHTVNAHYMQQQAAPLFYCTTIPNVLQEEAGRNCGSGWFPAASLRNYTACGWFHMPSFAVSGQVSKPPALERYQRHVRAIAPRGQGAFGTFPDKNRITATAKTAAILFFAVWRRIQRAALVMAKYLSFGMYSGMLLPEPRA